jgi:hypothetical protein
MGTAETELDPVQRLEIAQAVARVKARYFRHIDRKEWEGFRELFVDDVEIDVTDDMQAVGLDRSRGRSTGADGFVRRVARMLDGVVTVHHGHMPEIDVLGPDSARAIWAMEDRLEFPDGRVTEGAGHYFEEYRCVDGAWKIARLRLSRIRLRHD